MNIGGILKQFDIRNLESKSNYNNWKKNFINNISYWCKKNGFKVIKYISIFGWNVNGRKVT